MTQINVEMTGICKSFGEINALSEVTFSATAGEITAIVGENGAGKSTLMKILYGMFQPDSGEIIINKKSIKIHSPAYAIKLGIGMVHQHFMLASNMTALENIILGEEKTNFYGAIKYKQASLILKKLMKDSGLEIQLNSKIDDLPVGIQQRIEILKLLYRNSQTLILDEPTAVLTSLEVEDFFSSLRKLAERGKTIILITHKIKEVLSLSNKVVVMRKGRVAAVFRTCDATYNEIASAITGENLTQTRKIPKDKYGKTILSVKNIKVCNNKKVQTVNGISFEIKGGEILGIAGVEGNGQNELIEAVCGIRKPESGKILVNGENPHPSNVSHIPADRLKHGIVKEFNIEENIILGRQREKKFSNIFRIYTKQ